MQVLKFTTTILGLTCLFCGTNKQEEETGCQAQDESTIRPLTQVKLLPQHDMGKWKVKGANYSGITNLEPNKRAGESIAFALVSDKENKDGFYVFRIRQDERTGDITEIVPGELLGEKTADASKHDAEGIAYVPDLNTIYISYEDSQSILAYSLDGKPTGRKLNIPEELGAKAIYPNYGFEALTYDAKRNVVWTTTEHTLRADGEKNKVGMPCYLRLQAFGMDGQPTLQVVYQTEALQAKKGAKNYAFGVSALTALGDGTLLVLEREFYVTDNYAGSWVHHRIFRIQPEEGKSKGKELVAEFKTNLTLFSQDLANYEGMCLGPKLEDGRQTILLISDSQNNYGNRLYRMKDMIKVMVLK